MLPPRPRWSALTKVVVSLLLLAFCLYLLFRFGAILKPLILAITLAFVLSPLANALQNRLRLNRLLAVFFSYLLMLVVVVAIPMVIIPPLANQAAEMNVNIQELIQQAETLMGSSIRIAGQEIDGRALLERTVVSLQGMLEPVFTQTLGMLLEVISSLVWVIFILIVSFYLVKDSSILGSWVEKHVPPTYLPDYIRLRSEINHIWASFFRGQIVLALVVASIFTVAGLALGLPFALAMGVLAGLLEFLPSIGHGIWLSLATPLAFFLGSTQWPQLPHLLFALILVGLHLFYQQFDLNYLIPRIIGRSVHLAPVVVILGIVSGAVLAGVLGIFLAAPTIASSRVLARYIYANLSDQDPFPESVVTPLPPPNPLWWRKQSTDEASDPMHRV